jgi:hypothetical protein
VAAAAAGLVISSGFDGALFYCAAWAGFFFGVLHLAYGAAVDEADIALYLTDGA